MTDNIIRAWIAAADPDFGGSLGDEELEPLPPPRRELKWDASGSGIPYVYPHRNGYQFRPPGRYKLRPKMFHDYDEARAYVAALFGGTNDV